VCVCACVCVCVCACVRECDKSVLQIARETFYSTTSSDTYMQRESQGERMKTKDSARGEGEECD
jgi:hypothetical protein